jgi:hypothetical protein
MDHPKTWREIELEKARMAGWLSGYNKFPWDGVAMETLAEIKRCESCEGTGTDVRWDLGEVVDCPDCDGTGIEVTK